MRSTTPRMERFADAASAVPEGSTPVLGRAAGRLQNSLGVRLRGRRTGEAALLFRKSAIPAFRNAPAVATESLAGFIPIDRIQAEDRARSAPSPEGSSSQDGKPGAEPDPAHCPHPVDNLGDDCRWSGGCWRKWSGIRAMTMSWDGEGRARDGCRVLAPGSEMFAERLRASIGD